MVKIDVKKRNRVIGKNKVARFCGPLFYHYVGGLRCLSFVFCLTLANIANIISIPKRTKQSKLWHGI